MPLPVCIGQQIRLFDVINLLICVKYCQVAFLCFAKIERAVKVPSGLLWYPVAIEDAVLLEQSIWTD